MPFYDYTCQCGTQSIYSKIDSRDEPRFCPECTQPRARVQVCAPALRTFSPYRSPVNGQWIDSPNQRREDLKRSGSIEWEPGIKQDLPRLKKEADEKAFKPVEKALETTFRDMVNSGRA